MHPQSTAPTPAESARFLSKLQAGPDGCHRFTGALHPGGYGAFSFRNHPWRAHRFAWFLACGPIPEGMYVCHRCDERSCCNPAHLFLGTPTDNSRDMWAKGRKQNPSGGEHWTAIQPERVVRGDAHYLRRHPEKRRRGDQHPGAKLTWPAAREIRARAASGERYGSIARAFGISNATVGLIAQRKTWVE